MPETPNKLKVFLCHSSQDKPVVRELYEKLGTEGWVDPWLDEKQLLPGQDWNMEIEKAVEASQMVLVFLTNNSVNKEGYVQRELRMVLDIALSMPEDTIFVIPVKLEECQIPRRLAAWQWLNYFPLEERADAYGRLLASLRIRATKLGINFTTTYTEKETLAPSPLKLVSNTIEKTVLSNPDDSHLDLYIPLEYMDVSFVPPPARVKTWIFGGIEFVKIPHGEFLMGSKNDNKQASDTFYLPYDFLMARFQLTNEQFEKFVNATSYSTLAEKEGFGWIWDGNSWVKTKGADWKHPGGMKTNIVGKSKHPVVQVAWVDGLTYFEWLINEFGKDAPGNLVFRAPTEMEWEKAARGPDGRDFPWGNEFKPANCNSRESGRGNTTSVGLYCPQGDSPYGVCDMAGNVWEWTTGLWGRDTNVPEPIYRNKLGDASEMEKEVLRVVRGGSFFDGSEGVRATCRDRNLPFNWSYNFGFRIVLAPPLS